jgi:hypothetical protein
MQIVQTTRRLKNINTTIKGEIRLVTIFVTISNNPYSTATIFTINNAIENVTISIEVHTRLFQWIVFDYTDLDWNRHDFNRDFNH